MISSLIPAVARNLGRIAGGSLIKIDHFSKPATAYFKVGHPLFPSKIRDVN
jgi:hypothetical protein